MCIKIVERYKICRCIYYSHAVDACPAYGRRGHFVKTQEVSVGYTCSQHTVDSQSGRSGKYNYRDSRYRANGRAQYVREDGLKKPDSQSGALTKGAGYEPTVQGYTANGDALDVREDALKELDTRKFSGHESSENGDHAREDCLKNIDSRTHCWKESAGNNTVDLPLRSRLVEKFQKVLETDELFLPVGDLDEILTSHAIKDELNSLGLEDPSSFIFRRAKKIFAILLVIHKLDGVRELIREGYGDELLPLSTSVLGSVENEKPCFPFSNWDLHTRDRFCEFQWILLAPIFSKGEHLKLDDGVRLPFIKTEPIAKGAYGGVHQVEIHIDHEMFDPSHPKQKGNVYALKQYTRGTAEVNKRAFNRELDIMRSIRSSDHSHIVKLLATFEHRGQYSIILPLAEGNLRQFWAYATPSSDQAVWCLQQMAGIATALSSLHNDLLTEDLRPMRGYHMDLKPENVLIYPDASSDNRCWSLSDFGSSYLVPKESRQDLPPHPGLGTYEPPECQLGLPQSQAYDIWSLGCIFLECTAWLLKGSDAIDAFAEDRLNDADVSGDIFRDDHFFTVEFDASLTPLRTTTRPAVLRWIGDLIRDPKCNEAICELLILIKNDLLQADQNKRLKARHLGQRLESIHEHACRSKEEKGWTIFDSTVRELSSAQQQ